MKTVVRQRTLMCPLGIGRLGQDDACRFHRASDNVPPDGKCPIHGLPLERTTLREDKITMTVMGEEDIETEIVREDAARLVKGQAILSDVERSAYRGRRRADIVAAIAKARLLEDV